MQKKRQGSNDNNNLTSYPRNMRKKKKRNLNWNRLIATMLVILIMIVVIAWSNGWGPFIDLTQNSLKDCYKLTSEEAEVIKIINQPEIRSEPIVIGDERASNSFGKTKKKNFLVSVTKIYRAEKMIHDKDETFIGLNIKEISENAEGEEWFPSSITKDLDGIIWINQKNIRIVA